MLAKQLQQEGFTSKSGRLLDKGDIYKLLNNRTYVGEVTHKGQVYAGQHEGIVSRKLWDQVHELLQESPRVRGNRNRAQTPALLKGLIFGDGRPGAVAHPYAASWSALPLLCGPAAAEGTGRWREHRGSGVCRGDRDSRDRPGARRCCVSQRSSPARGWRHEPSHPDLTEVPRCENALARAGSTVG